MKRLLAIGATLAAVAAAVIAGSTLPEAMRQEMTCDEWAEMRKAATSQEPLDFFVAFTSGHRPPAAVGDFVLGDCDATGCTLGPAGCDEPLTYPARLGAAASGWRVARVTAPPYFARGWKALAASDSANVRFFSGWAEVRTACLSHFTGADCRTLLGGTSACWRRADGQLCREGRLYGPGVGGTQACTVQATDVPYPCHSEHDARWADAAVSSAFPDDSELVRQ